VRTAVAAGASRACVAEPIDRHAVVSRHHIVDSPLDMPLALGNGEFCFGVDGTGLQTLAGNSFSHWGKHSDPLPPGVTEKSIPETGTFDQGHIKGNMSTPTGAVRAWMFANPHPVNLGRLRFVDAAGEVLTGHQIEKGKRTHDLWQGVHTASFVYADTAVIVETFALPDRDGIAVRIQSKLLREGGIGVELDFPYPRDARRDEQVGTYRVHETTMKVSENKLTFERQMDDDRYAGAWYVMEGQARFECHPDAHKARLMPGGGDSLVFVCAFAPTEPDATPYEGFDAIRERTAGVWQTFWMSGGAIDLSGSKDARWKELERRVVLSQYLMRANNAGSLPPSEYGLMGTGHWSGQFHMEMVWWHMAHYGLWNRWPLAEKALTIYQRFLPIARKRAAQLDYKGAKWGKQNSPDGRMAPWAGNLGLNWQQPHPIFFAEQEYRLNPGKGILEKWQEVVFATADFMATFPVKDENGIYHLEFVRTANENGICHDSSFELAYWRWGLDKAQEWRKRLGMAPETSWQTVRDGLAPLTITKEQEAGADVYGWCAEWVGRVPKYLDRGHPDPIGGFAFVPFVEGVDSQIAADTVRHIEKTWNWGTCWGWDYPWSAMAAARTGQPDLAVDLLLSEAKKNSYSVRGINGDWYFPGNGGVLYAEAMMAAGWDGCPERDAPGFPDDGQWNVRWEGLKKAQ